MTREEKIEIMFESILSEVERVGKLLEGKDLKKVQNGSESVEEKIDNLSEKILNIRLPVPQSDVTPILNKLDELSQLLKAPRTGSNSVSSSSQKSLNLRSNTLRVFIAGLVLFLSSIGANIYYFMSVPTLQENNQKYQFIYHSGNAEYLERLDSLWQIDSVRNEYIEFIDNKKFSSKTN
ncbi:MAG: hypothetical protein RIA62_17395 [Cyclobacteriaceae bacterium]|tara:strand:- start:51 stop:587 length:537 start_codon:yes stop_codon:yes gene_type:complete